MRATCLMTATVMMALGSGGGSTLAGTIAFSGVDWTTNDNPQSTYQVIDANTGQITGTTDPNSDTFVTTPLSVEVGKTVSLDLDLDSGDLGGWDISITFGSNDNLATCCGGFIASDRILYRDPNAGLYFQSFVNNGEYASTTATTPYDGVRFSFMFDSATSAELSVSNQTSAGVYTPAFSQAVSFTDVSDIDFLRIGTYANAQPVTISNLSVVPEPAAASVLGVLLALTGAVRGGRVVAGRER